MMALPLAPRPAPRLSRRAAGLRSSVIRDLLKLTEREDVLSLAGGLPAPETFPMAELLAAAPDLLADAGSVQYSSTEGHAALRAWIAERSGLGADPDRVVVTHGSQQALDLVVRALCDPGDVVVIDSPGYLGALQVLEANECAIVPVPVDDQGLDTDHLATLLAAGLRPRLLATCPTFQNPTGVTMSPSRRLALAALADRYGFVVVEDDPYRALRWAGHDHPPIAASTEHGVWISTFSKTLAPGLRLGWLVAPAWLATAVTRLKQSADLHTSTLTQRLAAGLVTQPGWFDAHVAGLVPLYRDRSRALAAALRAELGDRIELTEPDGGMFLWARLPGVDTTALLPAAVDGGVAYVPGTAFHTADDPAAGHDTLRLSFATLPPAQLTEATRRLATVVRR